MDPILEEMQRAKDVRPERFRDWTRYLCTLVAAKDDEIATLKAQIDHILNDVSVLTGQYEPTVEQPVKRGPGRPRKTEVVNG
jgi:hypothetical protein